VPGVGPIQRWGASGQNGLRLVAGLCRTRHGQGGQVRSQRAERGFAGHPIMLEP
jgi:hypothetical protein